MIDRNPVTQKRTRTTLVTSKSMLAQAPSNVQETILESNSAHLDFLRDTLLA